MVRTVVSIPYMSDHGHRDQLFTHLQNNYWNSLGFELSIGVDDTQPFNRSKAINQSLNTKWDYAIIADADTWVPAEQLHEALKAAESNALVAAFNAVVELNRQCTMEILRGQTTFEGSFGAERVRTKELETQSSMLVISRKLWDQVGGMDQRFRNWGCEDNAFWHACHLWGGKPHRVRGNAYHLWHPPAPGKFRGSDYRKNLGLLRKYQQASTVEQLRAI